MLALRWQGHWTSLSLRDFSEPLFPAIHCLLTFSGSTNIKFLRNIVTDPGFVTSAVTTHYLEKNPKLFKPVSSNASQMNLLLSLLGDMVVNGPCTPLGTDLPASKVLPVCAFSLPQESPKGLNLKSVVL